MNRQEIAQRMSSAVIDVDKELAAKTHDEIAGYLHAMRREFNLKAIYEQLQIKAIGANMWIRFMGRSLEFTLNENEIIVNLISVDGEEEEFDVIRSLNEELVCNNGDFELKELDGFIQRAFGDLLD